MAFASLAPKMASNEIFFRNQKEETRYSSGRYRSRYNLRRAQAILCVWKPGKAELALTMALKKTLFLKPSNGWNKKVEDKLGCPLQPQSGRSTKQSHFEDVPQRILFQTPEGGKSNDQDTSIFIRQLEPRETLQRHEGPRKLRRAKDNCNL